MRARQFIFEYSRDKTAGVFGKKIIAAFRKDKSHGMSWVGKYQDFIQDKEVTPEMYKQIVDGVMSSLEGADPTANKEYVQWLTKVYANEGVQLEDLVSKTSEWLQKYDLYKKKKFFKGDYANFANIMNLSWKDLWEISVRADFQMMLKQQEEKAMPKGDAEQVFENDKVRIIVPKNKEAACYYGQGTTWCTAATSSANMFDTYNRSGPMYILLPKNPQYPGEKYQLHFESNQFMNEQDTPVDSVVELLDMRFGNLVDFFRKVEPQINDWLEFTPDEVLKPLIAKIKTATMDHVGEMVNEWESEDDYWYDYLRGKGYVYPEGHEDEGQIDWEKAYDNDESYTSWNYDVSDFISMVREAVDVTPEDIREIARDVDTDYVSDAYDIRNLDQIFSFRVEMNKGRDGDGGVAEWIKDHIYIKKTGGDGAWDVSLLYTQKDGQRKEYPIHL